MRERGLVGESVWSFLEAKDNVIFERNSTLHI